MIKKVELFVIAVAALGLLTAAPAGASDSGPLHWHTSQVVDPIHGGFASVSCVSPSFCLAGGRNGAVYRYDGERWSEQAQVDRHHGNIVALSCVSTSFCAAAAVGRGGSSRPLLYQDGTWRAAGRFVRVGGAVSGSCVSEKFCVIVNRDGSFESWDGTSWTKPRTVNSDGSRLRAVSCATTRYCLAGSGTGDIFRFDGAEWTRPHRIDPGGHAITGVSCPSPQWCLAVDGAGRALRHSGGRWHPAAQFDPRPQRREALDCPRVGYCVAVDGAARAYVYTHGAWHGGTAMARRLAVGVSCARPSFCEAVTRLGQASRKGRGFWTQKWVDPILGAGREVSCGSGASCVELDVNGGWLHYDGSAWSQPKRGPYAAELPLRYVSCPDAGFCLAMTISGRPARFVDGSWARSARLRDLQLVAGLSCSSNSMCVAVGADRAAAFDGHRWHVTQVPGVVDLSSVSCAARFCLATDSEGKIVRYRDGVWSAPNRWPSGELSVSCATAFCLAYGIHGRAFRFASGTWTSTARIFDGRHRVEDVSCTSRTFCVAVSATRETTYDGRRWSRPARIVPASSNLVSVSCAARSLCAAVSAHDGRAVIAA